MSEENKKNYQTGKEENPIIVADTMLPAALSILPINDRPFFPKMMVPVILPQNKAAQKLVNSIEKNSNYVGLVLALEDEPNVETRNLFKNGPNSLDQLHKIGVIAKILKVSSSKDGTHINLMAQALERFTLKEQLGDKPLRARVEYHYETTDSVDDEMKAYAVSIINAIKELVHLKPLFKEQLDFLMGQADVNKPGMLADFSAALTTGSGQELQHILEIIDIRERLEQVLILLKKELEISKLQASINKRIEERLSSQQREFFLKQQLKEIKKELGLSKGDQETELEKFQKRLETLELPNEEVRDRIQEEMEKLKVLEPSSAEFNVTRSYLDWLTILPWGVYTEDNNDIKKAAKILNQDHYGLTDVKERILETISVGALKGELSGSIILLTGAPGVGKTSVGQSIAKALGREFYRFSVGGMRDEAEIKGHRRTYIGAMPGKFIQAIKTSKTSNPIIMLDEVDKIGASFRGDPASALLEVLDPEQNKNFLDHYLDVRFDLSKILFICTANQIDTIPGPLLDRMEIINLSGYILEEKMEIAKKYLIPKQLEEHGLDKKRVKITAPVLKEIIEGYAREAGVRGLENNIKKIFRKCAKQIVENSDAEIKIARNDLPELLGRKIFNEEKLLKNPKAGVVTGLAYTSFGGATLFIEAAAVASKNAGFKQTGQLGSVMVESSEIAYSYVRSLEPKGEKLKTFFDQNFVHLHVPAGATPKDGPSAGITMACALYSLANDKPIVKNLAMTGELTLSGLVMPIGGVKEKVIAAKRAKISKLIFPEDNKKDFEDLDDHIKKGIQPYFVNNFQQVLKICFPGK